MSMLQETEWGVLVTPRALLVVVVWNATRRTSEVKVAYETVCTHKEQSSVVHQ